MLTHGLRSRQRPFGTRAITLTVVLCALVMQLSLSILPRSSADPYEASQPCASSAGDSYVGQIRTDANCEHTTAHEVTGAKYYSGDSPCDDPCCPNGCRHCPLPCCGGMPLAPLHQPGAVVSAVTIAAVTPHETFLLVEPRLIFHPPRC